MLYRPEDFPNLHAGNYRETGKASNRYNCIGWAAGRDDQWWDPIEPEEWEDNFYWPPKVPRDDRVSSLVMAFESIGFVICTDGSLVEVVEKIAIYAKGDDYTHAARQLESGKWTSKIGKLERIEHDAPESLIGPAYGQIVMYMQRKRLENA